MPQKPLGGDGLHVLRLPHAGQAKGVLGAHGLQQLPGGIGPLVVKLCLNGVDLIGLFPLDEPVQEAAVFRRVVKEQLPYKVQGLFQHRLPLGGKPVVHEPHIKARGLVVSSPPGNGADGSAVELIQPHGDLPQIPGTVAAPQQHTGDQGIHRRLLPGHGPNILNRQGILLKPPIPAAPQPHPGGQFDCFDHGNAPLKRCILRTQSSDKSVKYTVFVTNLM